MWGHLAQNSSSPDMTPKGIGTGALCGMGGPLCRFSVDGTGVKAGLTFSLQGRQQLPKEVGWALDQELAGWD